MFIAGSMPCVIASLYPVSPNHVWLFPLSFDNVNELAKSSLNQVTYSLVCVMYRNNWYFSLFPKNELRYTSYYSVMIHLFY